MAQIFRYLILSSVCVQTLCDQLQYFVNIRPKPLEEDSVFLMGKSWAWLGVFLLALSLSVHKGAAQNNNVAVQWNLLFCKLYCASSGILVEPNILFAHLHLAQWHALLALKDTGSCTTEEAVVAYASHKILANYFPFDLDAMIDPLLLSQLNALKLSESEERLGKRLGESVALALIQKRIPAREFSLQAFKAALNAGDKHLIPGVYRYMNDTPAGRDAATFILYTMTTVKPFLVPDPITEFIPTYLSEIKPVKVPSKEWDEQYNMLKVIGRAGPDRPRAWNLSAQTISPCGYVSSTGMCGIETTWAQITREVLPEDTSLYDTVVLFAKLSVAMHDALVVLTTLQHGFWFWRPIMAYRAGDPDHAPIPDWIPFLQTPPHAEYPSGSVTSTATGATVLRTFFGRDDIPFSLQRGSNSPSCTPSGVYTVDYTGFSDVVHKTQMARMYGGIHFNKSVIDGVTVGTIVANYVYSHWAQRTPSGVLPETPYLNVHIALPKKQGDWSPIELEL